MFGMLLRQLMGLLGSVYNLFPLGGTTGGIVVRQNGGTAGTDEVQISHDGSNAIISNPDAAGTYRFTNPGAPSTEYIVITKTSVNGSITNIGTGGALTLGGQTATVLLINGSYKAYLVASRFAVSSDYQFAFSSTTNADASADTGFKRDAAAVIATTNGSTGTGWLQNSAGTKRLTANVTSADTAMVNLTDLSMTLIAGRKYVGRLVLFAANTTAADGIRVDFDGGTATATSFIAGWEMVPGNTLSTYVNFSSTALATDLAISALSSTSQRVLAISFSIVCNAAGTFIPRISEDTNGVGTLTVAAGSYMVLEDSPN